MHRAAYRNYGSYQSIVTNQSVEAGPVMAGIRWWEIRNPGANAVLYQDSTYAPGITDGTHRWMGSIAQDSNGNMGMGYSAGSANLFPSVHYTGRLEGDPLNEMSQGEGIFVTGTGNENIITVDHLLGMKHLAIVANVGHFDNEIDMAGLEAMAKKGLVEKIEIKPQVHEWKFKNTTHGPGGKGHSIIVLAEGRLVLPALPRPQQLAAAARCPQGHGPCRPDRQRQTPSDPDLPADDRWWLPERSEEKFDAGRKGVVCGGQDRPLRDGWQCASEGSHADPAHRLAAEAGRQG